MPSERSPGQGGRTLAVAALQSAPVVGDPEATLRAFTEQVRDVAATFPFVRLLIAPELLLEAEPPFPRTATAREPSPIPGEATGRLGRLARETGLWLLPGTLYEAGEDGRVYNTAPVFSPDGEIAARYRKVFPWRPFEAAAEGSEFVVFDIPGAARIGLAICFDGHFPETYRQLAWMGAEVVVQPTLTPTRDRTQELVVARANAIVNQLYAVNVNGAAPTGAGESMVIDPEGLVRRQAGAHQEVLVDVLDIDAVRRTRTYGTAGVSRPLVLLAERDRPVPLPAYGGALSAPPWARDHLDHPRHGAEERP